MSQGYSSPLARAVRIGRIFAILMLDYVAASRLLRSQDPSALPALRKMVVDWCEKTFPLLGLKVEVIGVPLHTPCVFVGNHWSYLDIVVLLRHTTGAFLAKAEIARWPLIGRCARVVHTIFVDRDDKAKHAEAAERAADAVRREGRSVIIFPEGTTSIFGKPWKAGAMRIAARVGVPVQPFRLTYRPVRAAAYVDDDVLVPHLWRLLGKGTITARLEFGTPVVIPSEDQAAALMTQLHRWVHEGVREILAEDPDSLPLGAHSNADLKQAPGLEPGQTPGQGAEQGQPQPT